jgi:hypothetical protein
MPDARAADYVHVVAVVFTFIAWLAAGIQLTCWIAALWQSFFGAEDSRFEGEKLGYSSSHD